METLTTASQFTCEKISAETSLLRVFDDLHVLTDRSSAALLISMVLSATFDCIDHQMLRRHLETDFRLTNPGQKHSPPSTLYLPYTIGTSEMLCFQTSTYTTVVSLDSRYTYLIGKVHPTTSH